MLGKTRSDTVNRYLNEYKDYPARTLAKLIYEENKQLFEYSPNHTAQRRIDNIRTIMRGYTGQLGGARREQRKNKEHFRDARDSTPPSPELRNIVPSDKRFNVLLLDIETMPLLAYVFGIWEQNIGLNQIESDWFIATWAGKWLSDNVIFSYKLTPEEIKNQDDSRILTQLWHYLEEADVVIAHNADRFDIPRINTRFLFLNFPPPMPYQTIDTLKVAKKRFSLTSNKLDYLAKFLGVGEKIDTGGFELWSRCMRGEAEALQEMEEYNQHDVKILEGVYLKLRPYINSHPNMGLLDNTLNLICPSCGSKNIKSEGTYNTLVGTYEAMRCYDCGSISRGRITQVSREKRKNLLISTAR